MTRARCLHTEQNSRRIWAGNDPGIQGICYQCKLLRKVHSSPLSEPDHPGPYLVCAPCARVKCEWEPSHGHVGWAGTPPPGAEQWRNPWAMVAHLIPGIMVSSPKHDAQGREKKTSEDLQIRLSCPAGAGRSGASWEPEGAVGQFLQQQLHSSQVATTQNASPLILASPSRFSARAEDQVLPKHWRILSQKQGDSTFSTPGNRNII